jgi:hypothetical protein
MTEALETLSTIGGEITLKNYRILMFEALKIHF